MHNSSLLRMQWFVDNFASKIPGNAVKVLDVGSYDVNGSYRHLFSEHKYRYTGLDMEKGPNVDIVLDSPYNWDSIETDCYDVIISGQAFEHMEYFWITMSEMTRVLRKDGLLCIIAPNGFGEHRYPVDCYRFFTDGMVALARYCQLEPLHAHTNCAPNVYSTDWYSEGFADAILIARKPYSGDARHPDQKGYHCVPGDQEALRGGLVPFQSYLQWISHNRRQSCMSNPKRDPSSPPSQPDSYYRFSRPEVQALVPPSAKHILDVGCGAGALGQGLKERQECEVTGIEIVPEIAREASMFLDRVHCGDIMTVAGQLPRTHFDCIILADVLEHLIDPLGALRALIPCLNSEGIMVLSVPNVRHWSVLKGLLEGRWDYQDAGILDRTHLRFFTRQSFEHLLAQAGLKPLQIKATSLGEEMAPQEFIDALHPVELNTGTLQEESRAYQYLYTVEPAVKREPIRPKLSIIVLTMNGLSLTQDCLASIERCIQLPYELILVDNGSRDGTVEFLRAYTSSRKNVRLILNVENHGFAGGNNLGLSLARGEMILLLNNDTILTEGSIERMLDVFGRSPETGLVGPMSNHVSGRQLVKSVPYSTLAELEPFATELAAQHAGQSEETTRLVGFCLLMRREVVARLGGLDERFGSGNFEDDDFCLRARSVGFSCRIARDVFIHHVGGQTFKSAGIDYAKSMQRNWELFKKKWNIPPKTPIEEGYATPSEPPPAEGIFISLPDLTETHEPRQDRQIWEETAQDRIHIVLFGDEQTQDAFWNGLLSSTSSRNVSLVLAGDSLVEYSPLPDHWIVRKENRSLEDTLGSCFSEDGDIPLILLSSDCILTPCCLDRMIAVLRREQQLAGVGPTANRAPKPQKVPPKYQGIGPGLIQFAHRRSQEFAGQTKEAPFLGGFCLALNRKACQIIEHVNPEDGYAKQMWSLYARLTAAGYKLVVALDAYVHHFRLTQEEGRAFDDWWNRDCAVEEITHAGFQALEKGELDQAESLFAQSIHLHSEHGIGHAALGAVKFAQGSMEQAAASLQKATELGIRDVHTWNQLGVSQYALGQIDAAEEAFKRARLLDDTHMTTLLNLTELYRSRERYEEASESIKSALTLDSRHPDVICAFGHLSIELGDREGGIMALKRLQEIHPDDSGIASLQSALQDEALLQIVP